MHAHDLEPGRASGPHIAVDHSVERGATPTLESGVLDAGAVLNLQRLAGNAGVSSLLDEETDGSSAVQDVVGSGGGAPLDGSTRSFMESRLGHDFGAVRIHTGPKADESAKAINAHAYTVGTDVVFRDGKFAPGTASGMETIAHELTHVVQQQAGPVAGTPAPGGIKLSDPGDPFEVAAERSAAAVMSGETPLAAAGAGQSSVQRQGEEEEDQTAQTLIAQRQEDEEEEDQAGTR